MATLIDPGGTPVNVVNGATGTGTGNSIDFTFLMRGTGGARTFLMQLVPTGSFTAFTVDVQASLDGGTTWGTVASAQDLKSGIVALQVIGGPLYRLNVASFTGGTAATVVGSCN